MPSILLIRHAQASFGAADYDVLSDLAVDQIAALRAALVRRGLDQVRAVTGPAVRQRGTAALGDPQRTVPVDERWGEYRSDEVLAQYGADGLSLEGAEGPGGETLTTRDFQNLLDPALHRWIADGDASACDETWPAFLARVTSATEDVAASLGQGETALVFTSAGVIAAVCAALLGDADRCFVPLNRVQLNTGISKLAIGRSGISLISFNDHSHLDDVDKALLTYR